MVCLKPAVEMDKKGDGAPELAASAAVHFHAQRLCRELMLAGQLEW
jgi:hypothetical protein